MAIDRMSTVRDEQNDDEPAAEATKEEADADDLETAEAEVDEEAEQAAEAVAEQNYEEPAAALTTKEEADAEEPETAELEVDEEPWRKSGSSSSSIWIDRWQFEDEIRVKAEDVGEREAAAEQNDEEPAAAATTKEEADAEEPEEKDDAAEQPLPLPPPPPAPRPCGSADAKRTTWEWRKDQHGKWYRQGFEADGTPIRGTSGRGGKANKEQRQQLAASPEMAAAVDRFVHDEETPADVAFMKKAIGKAALDEMHLKRETRKQRL